MNEKESITEEMGLHKEWAKEARDMTLAKLPEFINRLMNEYNHDYGTICHAIACGSIATAWAMNNHKEQGGITGFQSGCIQWEMIDLWGSFEKGPKRMLTFENLLYPQYRDRFEKFISNETWEWVQSKAKENIEKDDGSCSPNVMSHWKSIVSGIIPFGFQIKDE